MSDVSMSGVVKAGSLLYNNRSPCQEISPCNVFFS